jgi:molybdenum cofactor cytidylyltransferase
MGTPKALLEYGGETFLDRLIGIFSRHAWEVMTVLGDHAALIEAGIRRANQSRIVINPNPARGQLSSLQCALAELSPASDAFVFTPMDVPSFRESTVAALVAAFDAARPLLAVPRCDGRRGHPVCASRVLVSEFLELGDGAAARDVIARHRDRTVYVEVDDPGILRDVDTPEDYASLAGAGTVR